MNFSLESLISACWQQEELVKEKFSLVFLAVIWLDWQEKSQPLLIIHIYFFFLLFFLVKEEQYRISLWWRNKYLEVCSVTRCYPKMCSICTLERWISVYGGNVSVSEWFLFLKSLFLLLLTKAQNLTLQMMQKSSPFPPSLLIVMFTL